MRRCGPVPPRRVPGRRRLPRALLRLPGGRRPRRCACAWPAGPAATSPWSRCTPPRARRARCPGAPRFSPPATPWSSWPASGRPGGWGWWRTGRRGGRGTRSGSGASARTCALWPRPCRCSRPRCASAAPCALGPSSRWRWRCRPGHGAAPANVNDGLRKGTGSAAAPWRPRRPAIRAKSGLRAPVCRLLHVPHAFRAKLVEDSQVCRLLQVGSPPERPGQLHPSPRCPPLAPPSAHHSQVPHRASSAPRPPNPPRRAPPAPRAPGQSCRASPCAGARSGG